MNKINDLCEKTQQQISKMSSDSVIMSVLLTFFAIFILKGFRLEKKEVLRALLLLFLMNCIVLNLYYKNHHKYKVDDEYFGYFKQNLQIVPTNKQTKQIYIAQEPKQMHQQNNSNVILSAKQTYQQKQNPVEMSQSNQSSQPSIVPLVFEENKTFIL